MPCTPITKTRRATPSRKLFFEDLADFAEIERVAKRMVDELLPKVREDKKCVRTMTVKVRYPDFSQESHGRSLAAATISKRRSTLWLLRCCAPRGRNRGRCDS